MLSLDNYLVSEFIQAGVIFAASSPAIVFGDETIGVPELLLEHWLLGGVQLQEFSVRGGVAHFEEMK